MHEIHKEIVIRLKEKENWSWVMIGLAVNESSDTVRKYYEKYKLESEIGPKPKCPKPRKISGINAIKVFKKQLDEPRISLRKSIWDCFWIGRSNLASRGS